MSNKILSSSKRVTDERIRGIMKITRTFFLKKETKNTYHLSEDPIDGSSIFGSIYIAKKALGGKPPAAVTISADIEYSI